MKLLLAAVLVCGGIYLLHRLALWAESRGFIYYLHSRPSRSALGNAFLEAQSLVEPGKRLLRGSPLQYMRTDDGYVLSYRDGRLTFSATHEHELAVERGYE